MKLIATFLVAIFVAVAGASFAFAECAGHTKAQLVKIESQEKANKSQTASTSTPLTVAEKTAEQATPAVKTSTTK